MEREFATTFWSGDLDFRGVRKHTRLEETARRDEKDQTLKPKNQQIKRKNCDGDRKLRARLFKKAEFAAPEIIGAGESPFQGE